MDFLAKIPAEVWSVASTGVVGAIGWFGKTIFDVWNQSRLPFLQDRDRYQSVMAIIDTADLYYFVRPDYGHVPERHINGLCDAAYRIGLVHSASYLNANLAKKERLLGTSLHQICEILALRTFAHRANPNVNTMYWDTFEAWNHEDQERANKIQQEIEAKRDNLIAAFEDFRDYGNNLFADRLVKAKPNG